MFDPNLAFNKEHDHGRCVSSALSRARSISKAKGQRLTPIRELVLKLVWQSHKPLGAYELLPALAEAGFNSAPPTVYRALDYLQELGLIHRLNSLNAYVGCADPQHSHPSGFMTCRDCLTTVELDTSGLSAELSRRADEIGFEIDTEVVELSGRCQACQDANHE